MTGKFCLGLALVFSGILLVSPAADAADNLKHDFCTETTENCVTVPVWNVSGATVTKTKVTQQSTGVTTCEEISTTVSENLQGGDGALSGKFTFRGDAKCRYHVVYTTTKGCIGDKEAKVRPDDMEKKKSVWLDKNCGTLKAYVSKD